MPALKRWGDAVIRDGQRSWNMRKRILGSLAVVAAGAGLSFGQGPPQGPVPGPGPGPGTMMNPGGPGGPGMGAPDSGLMLRNGQAIIPPPLVGGTLSPAEFGPPGLSPDMREPDGGIFGGLGGGGGGGGMGGGGGRGLGLWEQNGPPTFWVGFDYLMWWQKSMPMNDALVTSGTAAGGGVVNSPSTSVLLGDRSISPGRTSGLRTWVGWYSDEEKRNGFELSMFLMENRSIGQSFESSGLGVPLYAVPFREAVGNLNKAYVVSSPLTQFGGIRFLTQSQAYNIEGNCILNFYRADETSGNGIDFLFGMRFFDLEERMNMETHTTNLNGTILPFTGVPGQFGGPNSATIRTIDQIRTFNEFYGLNLGLRGDHNYGRIYYGWSAKFAAGYLNSYSDVRGGSSLDTLGTVSTAPGGRLIEPADIGRHRDGGFAFLPEGGLNLGYQLTSKIRLHAGYTFMYINRVIRPGSLYQQQVNGAMLPTDPNFGTAPSRAITHDLTKNSDYWLQGINFGLQIGF